MILNLSATESKAKVDKKTESVLIKINKAMGYDLDKVKKIKSFEQKGTVGIPAMQMQGTAKTISNGDKYFIKTNMAGLEETVVINGDKGWNNSLMSGLRELSLKEVFSSKLDTLFFKINVETFCDEIKFEGIEKFNNKDCLKLSFHKEGCESFYRFYDSKNFLSEGMTLVIETPQGSIPATVTTKELERHKEGFIFSKVSEITAGPMKMQLIVKSLEVNKEIDDKLFEKPKQ